MKRRWRLALLALCAALSSGCAALPMVPSLLGGLGGGNPPEVLIGTRVDLADANYCIVHSDVVGESRGLKLLVFFSVIPTSYVEAFGDLHRNAILDTARPQALVNIVHERTARNFLLFALTRVALRADVIEFLEPGAPCPRPVQPIQSSRSRFGTALAFSLEENRGAQKAEGGSSLMSHTIERSVEVEVPASAAYNAWTQFELFPHFMQDVEEVQQKGDRHLHWRARVWGKEEEWDAEITEQIPDKRIAWRSEGGASNAGVVTFHRLSDDRSRVMLQLEYDPERWSEKIGDALGLFTRSVESDLQGFKRFVEQRGEGIEGWRGEIPAKDDAAQRHSS